MVRSVSFIHRYIEDPKELFSLTKMPSFLQPEGKLTHAEIEDIARFLAHQRTPTAAKNDPREPIPAFARLGPCAHCQNLFDASGSAYTRNHQVMYP